MEELGVDVLIGLAEHRDEVARLPHVVGREEGVGRARLLAAGRAANAVDIILRVVGVVKVDDKFHVFHICKEWALTCGRDRKRERKEEGAQGVPASATTSTIPQR